MTQQGKTIAGAFVMDMIGYSSKYFGVTVEFSNKNGFVSKTIVRTPSLWLITLLVTMTHHYEAYPRRLYGKTVSHKHIRSRSSGLSQGAAAPL